LKVDYAREGAGKFRDLEIGTGADRALLEKVRQLVIAQHGCATFVNVRTVTNEGHPQYGQPYLSIEFFWNE
jgi:hypothetical protein